MLLLVWILLKKVQLLFKQGGGSSKVKESVDTILNLAGQIGGTATGHQLLNEEF